MQVLAAAILSLALASGAALLQPRGAPFAEPEQEGIAGLDGDGEPAAEAEAPDGGSEQA